MSLILRPHLVGAIRRQEKTQHLLRVAKHKVCPYKIGNSYAVQSIQHQEGIPRISSEKCRVRVVATWQSSLDRLTDEDAKQEGFDDLSQLIAWWRQKHNEGPMMDVPLHVVRFELDHEERLRYLGKVGYTHSAAMAIPESEAAIGEGLQERYSKEAQSRHTERETERRERWEAQRLSDRVRALESLPRSEVGRYLLGIERRVEAAERRLRREAA